MPITKNEIKDKTNEFSKYWFAGPKDLKVIAVGFGLLLALAIVFYISLGEDIGNLWGTFLIFILFILTTVYGLRKKLPEKTIYNSNFTLVAALLAVGATISLFEGGSVPFLGGFVAAYILLKTATWFGKKIYPLVYGDKANKWMNKLPQIHKTPLITFVSMVIFTLLLLVKMGLISSEFPIIAVPFTMLFGLIITALFKHKLTTIPAQIGYGILLAILGFVLLLLAVAVLFSYNNY